MVKLNVKIERISEARPKDPLKSLMVKRGRGKAHVNWNFFGKLLCFNGRSTLAASPRITGILMGVVIQAVPAGALDWVAQDEVGVPSFVLAREGQEANRVWLNRAGPREPNLPDAKD